MENLSQFLRQMLNYITRSVQLQFVQPPNQRNFISLTHGETGCTQFLVSRKRTSHHTNIMIYRIGCVIRKILTTIISPAFSRCYPQPPIPFTLAFLDWPPDVFSRKPILLLLLRIRRSTSFFVYISVTSCCRPMANIKYIVKNRLFCNQTICYLIASYAKFTLLIEMRFKIPLPQIVDDTIGAVS